MNDDVIARFTDEDGDDNALSAEFATATMGHVLLGQGRAAEARAVFAAVLARDPSDAEARRGLAALAPTPEAAPATPAYVRAVAMDPTTLVLHWSAPPHSLAHLTARPGDVALAAMVTSLRAGAVGVLTAHRTLTLAAREGELAVRGLEPGAVHHVALGARLGDRFVPFARAGGVATPTDAPLTYGHAPAPAPDATAADSHDAPAAPLSVEAAHARWAAGLASS